MIKLTLNPFPYFAGWLACTLAVPVVAQEAGDISPTELAINTERDYADKLTQSGYSDFARIVSADAKRRYPKSEIVFDAVEIRIDLAEGKFDAVEARIKAMPDQNSIETWSLRLVLANYYFAYQKFKEADDLYKAFFAAFKTPNDNTRDVFISAAYNYIQLLQRSGRNKEALDYYRLLLAQKKLSRQMLRNFQSEALAQMVLIAEETTNAEEKTKLINEIEGIAKNMAWIQDNFFGDAIIGLANAHRLRGNIGEAQNVIAEYMTDLMRIHESYLEADPDGSKGVLRMSPMPSCRYFLGKLLLDEAHREIAKGEGTDDEKIKDLFLGERNKKTRKRNGQGAYNHLINVFVSYPESVYAMQAADLSEEIQSIIMKRFQVKIGANIPESQRAKVRQQQFVGAGLLFSDNKYEEAAEAYSSTISRFGMTLESIAAMKNMVYSYLNLGVKDNKMDPTWQLYADAVVGQIAEGCSNVPAFTLMAGNVLCEIADRYDSMKMFAKKNEVLDLFSRFYSTHPRAASIAQARAKASLDSGNIDGAIKLYDQIVTHYNEPSQTQVKTAALHALYGIYQPKGQKPDTAKEMDVVKKMVALYDGIERPGQFAAVAQFRLADAYRHVADAIDEDTFLIPEIKDEAPEATAKRREEAVVAEKRKSYANAASIYRVLARELAKPNNKYQSTLAEKATNDIILEGSAFQAGICMQRIPVTSEKQKIAFQAAAMKGYQDYLTAYPKGVYAPRALLQVGTLYTVQGKMVEAQQTLDQLASTYPDSAEAKNAIPLLAESLFKMGMRGEAVAKYKQMIGTDGKYTIAQYIEAAKQLNSAKEYDVALEAIEKTLAIAKNGSQIAQALLIKTEALLALKKPEEAYKVAKGELLAKFAGTTVAMDAHLELIKVISHLMMVEKDAAARNRMIGEVKQSVRFIKTQRKDALTVDLDLAVANVALKRLQAEQALELDEETINDSRGAAVIAFDSLIFSNGAPSASFGEITEERLLNYELAKPYVEEAYMSLVKILMDADGNDNLKSAIENAERYLRVFPEGKFATEMRNALNNAKIKLGA